MKDTKSQPPGLGYMYARFTMAFVYKWQVLPKQKTIIFSYSTAQGPAAGEGSGGRRRPCLLIDGVLRPPAEMRSCHLENLAPFVTTHKNCETHRGTHKNDEARVCIYILGRKTLRQNWKCSFIRQQGDHKKLNLQPFQANHTHQLVDNCSGVTPRRLPPCEWTAYWKPKWAVWRNPIFFPSFSSLFWHCHLTVHGVVTGRG